MVVETMYLEIYGKIDEEELEKKKGRELKDLGRCSRGVFE